MKGEISMGIGVPNVDFTYINTPKAVKKYFVKLLGNKESKKLINAMKNRRWIIITGPHGATGKTTLSDVLRSIGYTYVIEKWLTTTIQVSEPLQVLQEKNSIFEELGISVKY